VVEKKGKGTTDKFLTTEEFTIKKGQTTKDAEKHEEKSNKIYI